MKNTTVSRRGRAQRSLKQRQFWFLHIRFFFLEYRYGPYGVLYVPISLIVQLSPKLGFSGSWIYANIGPSSPPLTMTLSPIIFWYILKLGRTNNAGAKICKKPHFTHFHLSISGTSVLRNFIIIVDNVMVMVGEECPMLS